MMWERGEKRHGRLIIESDLTQPLSIASLGTEIAKSKIAGTVVANVLSQQ